MPELPDVETYTRYLDATALHQPIAEVRVGAPRLLRGITPQALGRRLRGHAIESTRRTASICSPGWRTAAGWCCISA